VAAAAAGAAATVGAAVAAAVAAICDNICDGAAHQTPAAMAAERPTAGAVASLRRIYQPAAFEAARPATDDSAQSLPLPAPRPMRRVGRPG